MNEREFLKKIRQLQEGNNKIGLTNVNDIKSRLITENEEESYIEHIEEEEDIDTIPPDEQREEENKFKGIVSKLVKFEKIKVHKENVEWSGHLIREKIDWVFSLDDTVGCYIKTDDFLQLKNESLEVLKKLRGYYDVWSEEWAGRLTGASGEEEEQGGTF